MDDDDSFTVVSELSKSVSENKDVERVITVTIEVNEKSTRKSGFQFKEEDLDFQFTVTPRNGKSPLQLSQPITRQTKPRKPIDPRKKRNSPWKPRLVKEVTQSEERVTEEDILGAREKHLGELSFQTPNKLKMSKSLRVLDENSRSRVNVSALDRTKTPQKSPSRPHRHQSLSARPSPSKPKRSFSSTRTVSNTLDSSRTETSAILLEGSEFMPLIFKDRRRQEIGERPRFTTSQEGLEQSIHKRRPMVIIPDVNDEFPVFHGDDADETVMSQAPFSPIKAREEHETKRRVFAPRQETLNTSEFMALEKETEEHSKPKSSWLFIEVEKDKAKNSNSVELQPNMSVVSKIARNFLTTNQAFREVIVAMTKHRHDHFIAVISETTLIAIYRIGNDMEKMEWVWGSQVENPVQSSQKYFTYDTKQGKLVQSKEQKMSPCVDAISL